jgi:hypothetical protein
VNAGKRDAGRLLAVLALTCALMVVPYAVSAEENESQLRKLSAEWWQWAFAIPSSVNPLQDASGEHCMVGQRGNVWFLAGTILGTQATRTCAVPQLAELFFPIAKFFYCHQLSGLANARNHSGGARHSGLRLGRHADCES